MERHGVCIDSKFLQNLSGELAARLDILQQQIYTVSGVEFNINSPLQLQEVLYNKLQLPIRKKTPTGQPSTAEAVLQDLALDYELPKIILEYRSLSKLKSTYTDALPRQVNPKTSRIHTSYNQAVTATGRLSSTDPNLQNIPIRTEEGRKIRQAFIAPSGCKIVAADYSQIELRIMAHISQDPGLLRAFQIDTDIHKATAAEIFGIAIDQVTDSQRRSAKTINFGLIYGMSAFGLAKRLGIGNKEAQNYIELYFARYPGVKQYMEKTREFAEQHGFVETIFGRRLCIPEIKSKNFAQRSGAQRAAINAPMQGSAAEIMKIAMINMDNWIKTCNFKIAMIMQVHDELVFEVANDHVAVAVAQIRLIMENSAKLDVKALVDIGIGDNWEEAH
jgi:DNA polymerase-1